MLKLNLTNTPTWLALAPGVRLHLSPLTTAMMVSARADPAIEDLPETTSTEELALAMALLHKSIEGIHVVNPA